MWWGRSNPRWFYFWTSNREARVHKIMEWMVWGGWRGTIRLFWPFWGTRNYDKEILGPKTIKSICALKVKKMGPSFRLGAHKILTLGPKTKKWLRFFCFFLGWGPKFRFWEEYTPVSTSPQLLSNTGTGGTWHHHSSSVFWILSPLWFRRSWDLAGSQKWTFTNGQENSAMRCIRNEPS